MARGKCRARDAPAPPTIDEEHILLELGGFSPPFWHAEGPRARGVRAAARENPPLGPKISFSYGAGVVLGRVLAATGTSRGRTGRARRPPRPLGHKRNRNSHAKRSSAGPLSPSFFWQRSSEPAACFVRAASPGCGVSRRGAGRPSGGQTPPSRGARLRPPAQAALQGRQPPVRRLRPSHQPKWLTRHTMRARRHHMHVHDKTNHPGQ